MAMCFMRMYRIFSVFSAYEAYLKWSKANLLEETSEDRERLESEANNNNFSYFTAKTHMSGRKTPNTRSSGHSKRTISSSEKDR
jgi:hypothetical protein